MEPARNDAASRSITQCRASEATRQQKYSAVSLSIYARAREEAHVGRGRSVACVARASKNKNERIRNVKRRKSNNQPSPAHGPSCVLDTSQARMHSPHTLGTRAHDQTEQQTSNPAIFLYAIPLCLKTYTVGLLGVDMVSMLPTTGCARAVLRRSRLPIHSMVPPKVRNIQAPSAMHEKVALPSVDACRTAVGHTAAIGVVRATFAAHSRQCGSLSQVPQRPLHGCGNVRLAADI